MRIFVTMIDLYLSRWISHTQPLIYVEGILSLIGYSKGTLNIQCHVSYVPIHLSMTFLSTTMHHLMYEVHRQSFDITGMHLIKT